MSIAQQIGLFGAGQNLEPPDTQLAAGPSSVAEADNSTLSVWSRSGALVIAFDLNVFFNVPAGFAFTDPRLVYDSTSSRWFLTGFSSDVSSDSKIYVAVSATTDPGGAWTWYLIGTSAQVVTDQPMTGISADKLVISWNDYNTVPSFIGQQTWVLQKSDLLSSAPLHISAFGLDTTRFRIVPALALSFTNTEWLTYNNADCAWAPTCNRGVPTVGVVAINGTPLAANVTWTENDPTLTATTPPPSPRQPSGMPVVQALAIDDRFLSAVWQNGTLWVSGNDGCIPAGDSVVRSCMRLAAVLTGVAPSVAQDFDAGSSTFDLFYPAVTLDSSSDLFIAYSESSAALFPSAIGVDSLAGSPMNFENPNLIASGQTSYSGRRWGDYSGAAQDPLDPSDVWLTAEYQASASLPGDWGTATARLAIRPSIVAINPNSGSVNVQQPVTISGAHFQPGATIMFGSNQGTNVVVLSGTVITATTPTATIEGAVNVTLSQPDGTTATLASGYTYVRAAVSQGPPGTPVLRDPANQSGAASAGGRIVSSPRAGPGRRSPSMNLETQAGWSASLRPVASADSGDPFVSPTFLEWAGMWLEA
jgi:hypothetical protein